MVFSYFVVGLGVGALIQRTLDTHVNDYKLRNPIPSDDFLSDADSTGASAAEDSSNPGSVTMTQPSS